MSWFDDACKLAIRLSIRNRGREIDRDVTDYGEQILTMMEREYQLGWIRYASTQDAVEAFWDYTTLIAHRISYAIAGSDYNDDSDESKGET